VAIAERRPEFVLTYDGEALQAHRMAVAELAPALLALGEIFHEANEASDPNAPRVSLEIRAFDSGSFEVTLSLAQAGVGQDLLRFLTGQDTNALVNLIALVTGASGLFGVIVWIWRHTLLRQERVAPGVTRFIAEDGTTQYTSEAYTNVLASHGIRSSLSRPANCWDNAVAESFFSTLKLDLLYRHSWPTRATARSASFEYIEVFYNRERRHSTLGNRSPADYESDHAAVCSA
jgi:hypothetical protein